MEKQTVQNSDDYQAIIDDWRGHTYYFDDVLDLNGMVEMFRTKLFGEAEIQIIMACMMACGAKFKK